MADLHSVHSVDRGQVFLDQQTRFNGHDDDDAASRFMASVDDAIMPTKIERKPPKPSTRKQFKLIPIAEILQRQPEPWLVKGLLPRQGVIAIYGPSGSGKSMLVLDFLGAVNRGDAWFGYPTRKAPAVYICLEGVSGLAQRVKAYCAEVGTLDGVQVMETPFHLLNLEDEGDLVECILKAGLKGAVIIFDTLAQATAGLDENSGEDMTRAIAACQRIQAETEGLIVLIHHTGKDASKGLRGHSSMIGALDAALEVSGGQDDAPRQWLARKVKDGECGQVHPFSLRRVVLGEDEDGDEISSCVVSTEEASGFAVRRVKLPKGGNQKVALDVINAMLKAGGFSLVSEAPASAPPGRPVIRLDDAVEQVRSRLTCEKFQRKRSAQIAIQGLSTSGIIGLQDDFIWLL